MPQPLRMHQIRRVIEFHQQGIGVREIARLSGLSRNTIREYLKRIVSSGLTPEELLHLSDELLSPIVYTEAWVRYLQDIQPGVKNALTTRGGTINNV
ncbi:hypothetical protein BH10BAC4_BH10BAC4_06510 [soil metagenome]